MTTANQNVCRSLCIRVKTRTKIPTNIEAEKKAAKLQRLKEFLDVINACSYASIYSCLLIKFPLLNLYE